VRKEIGSAISRQASGSDFIIVPIYDVDLARPHHWLADIRGLHVSDQDVSHVIPELVTALRGEAPPTAGTGFASFVSNLIQLNPDAFWTVSTQWSLALRPVETPHDESIAKRARAAIVDALKGAKAEDAIERVLAALDERLPAPIVSQNHIVELRRFARRSESIHLELTEYLKNVSRKYHGGTTRGEFVETVSRWFANDIPDESLREWRCEELFEEAKSLGLLSRRSSEYVYDPREQLNDPSVDWGPMLNIVAPLVTLFRRGREIALGFNEENLAAD
jgi:hypothetical protein